MHGRACSEYFEKRCRTPEASSRSPPPQLLHGFRAPMKSLCPSVYDSGFMLGSRSRTWRTNAPGSSWLQGPALAGFVLLHWSGELSTPDAELLLCCGTRTGLPTSSSSPCLLFITGAWYLPLLVSFPWLLFPPLERPLHLPTWLLPVAPCLSRSSTAMASPSRALHSECVEPVMFFYPQCAITCPASSCVAELRGRTAWTLPLQVV